MQINNNSELKNFLKKNEDLVNNGDVIGLYKRVPKFLFKDLTLVLIKIGINPLKSYRKYFENFIQFGFGIESHQGVKNKWYQWFEPIESIFDSLSADVVLIADLLDLKIKFRIEYDEIKFDDDNLEVLCKLSKIASAYSDDDLVKLAKQGPSKIDLNSLYKKVDSSVWAVYNNNELVSENVDDIKYFLSVLHNPQNDIDCGWATPKKVILTVSWINKELKQEELNYEWDVEDNNYYLVNNDAYSDYDDTIVYSDAYDETIFSKYLNKALLDYIDKV